MKFLLDSFICITGMEADVWQRDCLSSSRSWLTRDFSYSVPRTSELDQESSLVSCLIVEAGDSRDEFLRACTRS